jgi:hypothetical protein
MDYFEVSNGCWLRRLLTAERVLVHGAAYRSLGSVPSTQSWGINRGTDGWLSPVSRFHGAPDQHSNHNPLAANFTIHPTVADRREGWKNSTPPGGANQFAGGRLHPLKSSAFPRRTLSPTKKD